MNLLKRIIERNDAIAGRTFDLLIQAMIIVAMISFSLETIPDLSESQRSWLHWIEIVTVTVFSIEYVLRFLLSENKMRFVFSFFGIVDLLAILPFYISTGIDLRSIRAFRLLRLFRTLKLARYSVAIRRLHCAARIAREEIVLFLAVSGIILYLASVGIYHFENQGQPETFSSIFASLWWSVCTLTTVGYGDVYPITTGGRIFTFVVLIFGLGVVTLPSGLIATALSEAREQEKNPTMEDENNTSTKTNVDQLPPEAETQRVWPGNPIEFQYFVQSDICSVD